MAFPQHNPLKKKQGVSTPFKFLDKKCVYTHCYGHALSLAVGDAIESVDLLESIFDTACEISNR